MKSYKHLLAGLILSGGLCGPAFSNSTNTYLLDGITIWDLSGNYSDEVLSMDYSISQDGKGKLVGNGTAVYSDIDFNATADVTIKGQLKTRKKSTRLHFVVKGEGTAESAVLPPVLDPSLPPTTNSAPSATVPFALSGNCTADVSPQGDALLGTIKLELQIGEETIAIKKLFEQPIPEGMDGSAALEVILDDSAKKLIGSAILTLSNGSQLDFTVKGSQSRKGGASLKLTGQGEARGSKLSLKTDAEDKLAQLKGKVMGQKIQVQPAKSKKPRKK